MYRPHVPYFRSQRRPKRVLEVDRTPALPGQWRVASEERGLHEIPYLRFEERRSAAECGRALTVVGVAVAVGGVVALIGISSSTGKLVQEDLRTPERCHHRSATRRQATSDQRLGRQSRQRDREDSRRQSRQSRPGRFHVDRGIGRRRRCRARLGSRLAVDAEARNHCRRNA